MTPDTALIAFVGDALFHAFTHVYVHDAKIKLERFIHRPERLRNHDVSTAIKKAFGTTVKKLRAEYKKEYPDDAAASAAFDALSGFNFDAHEDTEADPEKWLSFEYASGSLKHMLSDVAPNAPANVRRFLEDRFPPLFVFAFREIGLKADEKVRAVVFESVLRSLADSNEKLKALVVSKDEALQAGFQELASELHRIDDSNERLVARVMSSDEALREGLKDLGYHMSPMIDELLDELRGLKMRVNREHLGDGPVVAYVRVDDLHGNTLRTEPLRKRRFLIGRGGNEQGIAINLDDMKVSRLHAEIILDDSGVLVEDRNSRHGTFVQGQELEARQHVGFGTAISIGPFQLCVLAPNASAEELLTAPTERS